MDVLRLWEVSASPGDESICISSMGLMVLVLPVVSHVVPPLQVMWTRLPCENFHLLVCCAILDSEKQKIMEENYGFNEILKVSCSHHTERWLMKRLVDIQNQASKLAFLITSQCRKPDRYVNLWSKT